MGSSGRSTSALNESVNLNGTGAGGPDGSDSTYRATVKSYQTNGDNFFGEVERFDLMEPYAKGMLAWRLQRPPSGDLLVLGPANRSFETDTTGWSAVGAATIARSTVRDVIGGASCRITWATGAADGQGASAAVTGLTIGHSYTFYAWVWNVDGPAIHLDVSGITGTSSSSATTGQWEKLSYTFTATATSHTIRVLNAGSATAAKTCFFDLPYVAPAPASLGALRSVAWVGAHWGSQDDATATDHGHISIEVPDASDSLRTRLEIKFVDSTGAIGLDKTLVQTLNADLVVDCSNGQVLRLRTGAGAVKMIEFGNDQWGAAPRWMMGQNGTAEGGANAGSDWQLTRYNDSGVAQDQPIIVTRSNGKVTFGGTSGTGAGVAVNRSSAGTAIAVDTYLSAAGSNGAIGLQHTAKDATSRALNVFIATDTTARFVAFADGTLDWGPGNASRDVSVKRTAAGVLTVAGGGGSGTASLVIGTAAVATSATDGFLYVPSCAGIPTGTPTTQTGTVPIVADTTNTRLDFYAGSKWWQLRRNDGWTGLDSSFFAQSMLPEATGGGLTPSAAGTLMLQRIHLLAPQSVTNIVGRVITQGSGLTSGQCFAALFTSAGVLVGTTADQSGTWNSTGLKTMALSGGPFTCPAGDYYVGWFYNGTGPQFAGRNAQVVNDGFSAPNFRSCVADTGLTTTMPNPFTTQTSNANCFLFWLS